MARSYKHTPCIKLYFNSKKEIKRFANKKVRRTKDIPNGKYYRKLFQSWDINDWCVFGFGRREFYGWKYSEDYSSYKEYLREYVKK